MSDLLRYISNAGCYLVEVCPQEVNLLVTLEQAGPEIGLQLFLAQDHLNIGRCVVGLGVLDIDVAVELELKVICCLLGV